MSERHSVGRRRWERSCAGIVQTFAGSAGLATGAFPVPARRGLRRSRHAGERSEKRGHAVRAALALAIAAPVIGRRLGCRSRTDPEEVVVTGSRISRENDGRVTLQTIGHMDIRLTGRGDIADVRPRAAGAAHLSLIRERPSLLGHEIGESILRSRPRRRTHAGASGAPARLRRGGLAVRRRGSIPRGAHRARRGAHRRRVLEPSTAPTPSRASSTSSSSTTSRARGRRADRHLERGRRRAGRQLSALFGNELRRRRGNITVAVDYLHNESIDTATATTSRTTTPSAFVMEPPELRFQDVRRRMINFRRDNERTPAAPWLHDSAGRLRRSTTCEFGTPAMTAAEQRARAANAATAVRGAAPARWRRGARRDRRSELRPDLRVRATGTTVTSSVPGVVRSTRRRPAPRSPAVAGPSTSATGAVRPYQDGPPPELNQFHHRVRIAYSTVMDAEGGSLVRQRQRPLPADGSGQRLRGLKYVSRRSLRAFRVSLRGWTIALDKNACRGRTAAAADGGLFIVLRSPRSLGDNVDHEDADDDPLQSAASTSWTTSTWDVAQNYGKFEREQEDARRGTSGSRLSSPRIETFVTRRRATIGVSAGHRRDSARRPRSSTSRAFDPGFAHLHESR